jgi:hypothetical protein
LKLPSDIHDQVVVECTDDDQVLDRKTEIEELLVAGMHTVIPDILVKVETVITQSLDKSDIDCCYSASKSESIAPEPVQAKPVLSKPEKSEIWPGPAFA